ncbi:DNA helicase RecQ [Rhodobacter capsulatus]|uniref:DNA helicase RecQ n=2 Tax=Rhodobacter capsulatus TaxID=1061 RepID=D5AST6_RHOCB|nr:DNA helicase RecQ [Rhodobacter capsulatus]ADE87177.1 ATP-dependent DNA helicase RecQ [Rhodobacter capsulatus SB 1003]ETD03404.1 ATP-dependent DNA helicase RecQ [Rhodobacter capsulatus DE442]ETD80199.1 ATP-dependent DNA helicase RecQ [Rhodobacter capsulatus R121]ETE55463.1 ATP-dependent DNA helicase RecQ [Rhodobacter capsulatus Y262]MDS0925274.1 DNA helicase RecQ [Rhodobacter capsulatus]
MTLPDPSPEAMLASVFGFHAFRPGQEEIVRAVLAGRNTLAIMPTGGGKSLCFQLPALCLPGLTVVISPLIALMRDQVRSLREAGVEAGALTSGNTEEETEAVFAAIDAGRLKLLYIAPERLAGSGTLALLRRAKTGLIAVDEAHCVSQWGHDFRPDYLRIGDLRRALDVPLAAFTATADEETRAEIVTRLFDGIPPATFLRGFDRPNISLAFEPKDQPRRQILDYVAARRGQSGIVYCASRAKTEQLAAALIEAGHPACHYHGGMEAEDRRRVETRFQREDGLIVVATVAFGMGIDKPDIRWVAHADLPKSIESYYQEIGRAGRDGAPAETLTLYGADDVRFRRQQIDEGLAPPERKAADHGRLNALLGLAEATGCRRQRLLAYFGETSGPCGNCDLCETPPDLFDGTEAVRKALSAALRTEESYGAGHLIEVLLGQTNDRITARGHDRLPTFGVGKDLSRTEWQAVFRQMQGHDLIRPDAARHGALVMTDRARPILRGEERITLRRDLVRKAKVRHVPKALVSDEDAPLLSALKAKRRALAEAAGLPAYMIFPDRTLIEMAELRPTTLDQFAQVNGVGAKKLESYGRAFLEVIAGAGAAEPVHPARRKLAGTAAASLYDALDGAQRALARGEDGHERFLSCTATMLRRIAEVKPKTRADLERIAGMGEAKLDRFADAFLALIAEHG